MALLHQAELRPSKLELLTGWAPLQPWFAGDSGVELTSAGAYRFDDPDGEVGVETLLVRAGDGPVMQMPLTYRSVPLADADDWLIGTLRHSVLGTRWVYDGTGDPVYLLTVMTTIIAGGSQAELYLEIEGERVKRESTAKVSGSGIDGASLPGLPSVHDLSVRNDRQDTVVETGDWTVTVPRVLSAHQNDADQNDVSLYDVDPAGGVLTGTWADQAERRPLVFVAPR
ncbi:MAG: hypothetical protein WED09_04475 [Homoserinimonas sp.]